MIRQLSLLVLLAAPASALEWVPVFDTQMLAGQVFQDDKPSAWQGNASLQFTPAVKLNESFGVIPTYAGNYLGTKSVTELGGGGQLFQDSQSHSLSLKALWKVSETVKLKPSIGHRWEFLRETTDEDWGKGLFDYRKPSGGLEADWAPLERVKLYASYDYYEIAFPNYRSLESKSPGLGREQAEGRTLDTSNHSWGWGGTFPLPVEGSWGKLAFNVTRRANAEQHIVVASGQLTSETRLDDIKSVSGQVNYGRAFSKKVGAVASVGYTFTRYRSNQNHYDAELNIFNRDFYSYEERALQPQVSVFLGSRKVECDLSYLRIERRYLGRMAQDAAGTYQQHTVSVDQDSFLMGLAIPLKHGFRLIGRAGITKSASNNTNEKAFKYNYTLSNHLVGFSWSY